MSRTPRPAGGFTLLEVMVAMAILAFAVVTAIQLSSQSLRLLTLSGEHQQAALLADQMLRATDAREERVDTGETGPFAWERRIALIPSVKELAPASGIEPQLLSVSISVRWGANRHLEMATLRTTAASAQQAVSR